MIIEKKVEDPLSSSLEMGKALPDIPPPPYILPETRNHESPSRPPLHPQQQRSLQSPQSSRSSSSIGPPESSRSSMRQAFFQPRAEQTINKLDIYSRHHPISGSFIIDPTLPGPSIRDRQDRLRRPRKPLDKKNKKYFKTKHITNALFTTRSGDISLDLATASEVEEISKSYIQVASREGNVKVNLFSVQPKKHICLEVSTRDGHLLAFLPDGFHGIIQTRSHKLPVEFLPAFALQARVLRASDKESLILFGSTNDVLSDLHNEALDLCFLSTHSGKITIGLSGADKYVQEKEVSLLQKIGAFSSKLLLGTDITSTKGDYII